MNEKGVYSMDKKFARVSETIILGEVDAGVIEVERLLSGDVKAETLLVECIEPTLELLGEQFSEMEVFLPELINAADVVDHIKETMAPFMDSPDGVKPLATVVIGTVYGDLHSIGKNMVSLMLQLEGFKVHDLGVDLHPQSIVDQAVRLNADLICLSALMLTSRLYLKDTLDMARNHLGLRDCKILVGGGSVDGRWADEIGADGYAPDAARAAKVARKMMAGI
jgi:5-methyltetrahydrofolate--homocysteine methyltransferase